MREQCSNASSNFQMLSNGSKWFQINSNGSVWFLSARTTSNGLSELFQCGQATMRVCEQYPDEKFQ